MTDNMNSNILFGFLTTYLRSYLKMLVDFILIQYINTNIYLKRLNMNSKLDEIAQSQENILTKTFRLPYTYSNILMHIQCTL